MTDYDAQIARLKLDAMRQLKLNFHLPFAISPGDSPAAWDAILNKILAPALGQLMGALINRDQWRTTAEELQREIDAVTSKIGEMEDEVGRLEDRLNRHRATTEGISV
jgi:hypothetical protein